MVGLPGQALGGQDVPPGGIAPQAYGSAPQAPASFKRNTIDVGSEGLLPYPSAARGAGRKLKHSAPSVHSTLNDMDGGVVVGNPGHPSHSRKGVQQAKVVGGARSARGEMIKKIMKEKGLSLGQASKYLKENGSD
jgi:hypothetical protein